MGLILVVDDDPDMRRRLLVSLRSLGHSAFGRESGRLGLDLLARQPTFDVVIARFGLPKMSGAEFLRAAAMTVPSAASILIVGGRFDPRKHRQPSDAWLVIEDRDLTLDTLQRTVDLALRSRGGRGEQVASGGAGSPTG